MKRLTMLAAVVALVAPWEAMARPPHRSPRGPHGPPGPPPGCPAALHLPLPMLRQHLKLTPAQRNKVRQLRGQTVPRLIEIGAKLATVGFQLRQNLEVDSPDEAKVLGLVRKSVKLHGRRAVASMKAYLALRAALQPAQRERLFRVCHPPPPRRPRFGPGRGRHRGPGPGHGPFRRP